MRIASIRAHSLMMEMKGSTRKESSAEREGKAEHHRMHLQIAALGSGEEEEAENLEEGGGEARQSVVGVSSKASVMHLLLAFGFWMATTGCSMSITLIRNV